MSKANEIMDKKISVGEKLMLMKEHYNKVDKWLNENKETQDTYSEDELYEMVKEILDYIVELDRSKK